MTERSYLSLERPPILPETRGDRAVERELGGRAGEDEQYHVSVSPDPAHDGMLTHEIRHRQSMLGCCEKYLLS
jgi:hypothetical protein